MQQEPPCPDPRTGEGPSPPGASEVPDPETVAAEFTLTSPKGRTYRVLRTNQVDGYETPPDVVPGEGSPETPDNPQDADSG